MVPSIGRIVHYVEGGVHFAAMVIKVWTDTCVNLAVFPNGCDPLSTGYECVRSVNFSADAAEGTCHWPEVIAPVAAASTASVAQ